MIRIWLQYGWLIIWGEFLGKLIANATFILGVGSVEAINAEQI